MALHEAFAILVMALAIGALIWFINFVERNLPDALGDAWGDWPNVPDELAADGEGCVGGRDGLEAAGRITHTNDASHPSQGGI